MTQPADRTLTIDIVSDVVCPWCIVGSKQLETALQWTGLAAAVRWHPFELNPNMPAEGQHLGEHITQKYGTTAEQGAKVRDHITALGAELGFVFNYADDMRMVNTFRAHQLLHWAREQGREHDLKMALFAAYFTDRRDVSDPAVLAEVAGAIGLDAAEAAAVLADARYAQATRDELDTWTARGITGVPAMIFERQHLVVGAQGVNKYAVFLRHLAEGQAA